MSRCNILLIIESITSMPVPKFALAAALASNPIASFITKQRSEVFSFWLLKRSCNYISKKALCGLSLEPFYNYRRIYLMKSLLDSKNQHYWFASRVCLLCHCSTRKHLLVTVAHVKGLGSARGCHFCFLQFPEDIKYGPFCSFLGFGRLIFLLGWLVFVPTSKFVTEL